MKIYLGSNMDYINFFYPKYLIMDLSFIYFYQKPELTKHFSKYRFPFVSKILTFFY